MVTWSGLQRRVGPPLIPVLKCSEPGKRSVFSAEMVALLDQICWIWSWQVGREQPKEEDKNNILLKLQVCMVSTQVDLSAVVIMYCLAVWFISLSNKSELRVSSVEFSLVNVVFLH